MRILFGELCLIIGIMFAEAEIRFDTRCCFGIGLDFALR
jgi:hypothetical protein